MFPRFQLYARVYMCIWMLIGALGLASKDLEGWNTKLGLEIRNYLLHETALLGTARILRKAQEA